MPFELLPLFGMADHLVSGIFIWLVWLAQHATNELLVIACLMLPFAMWSRHSRSRARFSRAIVISSTSMVLFALLVMIASLRAGLPTMLSVKLIIAVILACFALVVAWRGF